MMELDETQQAAKELMLTAKHGIVTGGPGTGKTTVLGQVVREMRSTITTTCLAPTGKAAKRISETMGDGLSQTIHRALAATKGIGGWQFGFNEHNPMPHRTVFVDESSMVSVDLAAHLVRAVAKDARLIWIGDANQLPSVGPGQVFRDLIDSGRVPVVRLTKLHRAAQESWVCKNAEYVLFGDIDLRPADDFSWIELKDPEDTRAAVVEVARKAMRDGEDFQVLAPQGPGPIGTDVLNNAVQTATSRYIYEEPLISAKSKHGVDYALYPEDKVICISNDYEKVVFNGEVGTIKPTSSRERATVDFGDREVLYTMKELRKEFRLAHALTVHKSQGSEWDHVVVVCHGLHRRMWSRQLFYTAITRARRKVTIIGNFDGLAMAVGNDAPRHRSTTLRMRLDG